VDLHSIQLHLLPANYQLNDQIKPKLLGKNL